MTLTSPETKTMIDRKIPLYTKAVMIFGCLFFLMAVVLTYLGLFGEYWTTVFGYQWGLMRDPGGWYLPSGTYFFRKEYVSFFGHPGLLLQAVIGIITELSYFIYHFWGNASYPSFIVKNYPAIIYGISIIISILHLLTFYFLFDLGKRFFSEGIYRTISVIAYGTTLTVLLYINSISPDPFCVFLIVISIWSLFNGIERIQNNKEYRWYIILSSLALTTACFSKAVYGIPAFAAMILYLFFYKHPVFNDNPSYRKRVIGIYILVSIAVMALWITKVDPSIFFNSWSEIFVRYSSSTGERLKDLLLVHPNVFDLTLVCEAVYLLFSIWGIITMYKNSSQEIKNYLALMVLISLFIWPVTLLKLSPHYFIVHYALYSIPFAYQIKYFYDRYFKTSVTQNQKFIIAILFIGCIHWTSFEFFYTAQIQNIQSYRRFAKSIYHVLDEIDYDEKIAIDTSHRLFTQYFGFTKYTPVEITESFKEFFIVTDDIDSAKNTDAKYFIHIGDTSASSIPLE